MTLRSNGSYIGPRPAGPSALVASGIWDLRTVERQRRASAWPGQPLDSEFSSVRLLLHMDGSGSTFTDSSGTPKTVAAGGGVTQSAAQSKFGGKSAYFDGTGDYLTWDNAGVAVGTANFTIEFWLYFVASATNNADFGSCLFDTRGSAQSFRGLALFANASGNLRTFDNNSVINQADAVVPFNQWCHVAVSRSGTTQRVFVDGVEVLAYSSSYNHDGQQLTIGGTVDYRDATSDFKLNGYIDDFRFSTVARYTGSFTPPTAAFPDA